MTINTNYSFKKHLYSAAALTILVGYHGMSSLSADHHGHKDDAPANKAKTDTSCYDKPCLTIRKDSYFFKPSDHPLADEDTDFDSIHAVEMRYHLPYNVLSFDVGVKGVLDIERGLSGAFLADMRYNYNDWALFGLYNETGCRKSEVEYNRHKHLNLSYTKLMANAAFKVSDGIYFGLSGMAQKSLKTYKNQEWKVAGEIASLLPASVQILGLDNNFAIDPTTNQLFYTANQRVGVGATKALDYYAFNATIAAEICHYLVNAELSYVRADYDKRADEDHYGLTLSAARAWENPFIGRKNAYKLHSDFGLSAYYNEATKKTDLGMYCSINIPLNTRKSTEPCIDGAQSLHRMMDMSQRIRSFETKDDRNEEAFKVNVDPVYDKNGLEVFFYVGGNVGAAGDGVVTATDTPALVGGLDTTKRNVIFVNEDVTIAAGSIILKDNTTLLGGNKPLIFFNQDGNREWRFENLAALNQPTITSTSAVDPVVVVDGDNVEIVNSLIASFGGDLIQSDGNDNLLIDCVTGDMRNSGTGRGIVFFNGDGLLIDNSNFGGDEDNLAAGIGFEGNAANDVVINNSRFDKYVAGINVWTFNGTAAQGVDDFLDPTTNVTTNGLVIPVFLFAEDGVVDSFTVLP